MAACPMISVAFAACRVTHGILRLIRTFFILRDDNIRRFYAGIIRRILPNKMMLRRVLVIIRCRQSAACHENGKKQKKDQYYRNSSGQISAFCLISSRFSHLFSFYNFYVYQQLSFRKREASRAGTTRCPLLFD